VTPSLSPDGSIRGYHSFRRQVSRDVIAEASAMYAQVLALEATEKTKADQVRVGVEAVRAAFGDLDLGYDRWSWKAAP
jgi:hypothetical protein